MAAAHESNDNCSKGCCSIKPLKPYEMSELHLLNSLIIEKNESIKKAIKFLTKASIKSKILDQIQYNERLAYLYM